MLATAHFLLIAAYLSLPVIAVGLSAWWAVRKRSVAMSRAVTGTFAGGIIIGTALSITYALFLGGRLSLLEMLIAAYLATSLMMTLKIFDWFASYPLRRSIHAAKTWLPREEDDVDHRRPTQLPSRLRLAIVASALFRVALLVLIGMPSAMAAVLVYRPKVTPTENPLQAIGAKFDDVNFTATDGVNIAGWWIPAGGTAASSKTVLLCHGLGAGAAKELQAAKKFVPAGYNVLLFDFRGHGRSDGHLLSFGDLERRDVLAAVKWLRTERPQQSQRILGLGMSVGGAALISAAADDSAEGRAIDAVAVFGCYDSFPELVKSLANSRFVFPFNTLMNWVGVPIASVGTGVDLSEFVPARYAEMLWPRPLLVIHEQSETGLPFERGQVLYQRAGEPKRRLWLPGLDRSKVFLEDGAADAVLDFFREAKSVPLI